MKTQWTRREMLAAAGATAVVPAAGAALAATPGRVVEKGRVRQSVCRWCYRGLSVEELAVAARDLGLESVELLAPAELEVVARAGLRCAVVNSHSIEEGLNDTRHHERCVAKIQESIEAAARWESPNVITFSGNRGGIDDETGLENCVAALRRVLPLAEKQGVTVVMELLNSKVDHRDYMADNTPWGVELVERVGSPRFKLLYDIYHMQIMEGDVIRTIREHHDAIAHYHTAGVPGRHELDEDQELQYPAIMRAILDTGFDGFVAQEFIPRGDDPLASLAHGVRVCDV